MFDFLPSPAPNETPTTADDHPEEPAGATAAEPTAFVSDVAEEIHAETESPADLASDESEASAVLDETDPPDVAPEKKAPTAVSKATTGDEDLVDLPDFSHEPTEPGQYTLRIVFTFRPGDQSVLFSTKSHDVLAIVSEVEPTVARALLATFIAAHEARLGEIKEALAKPTTTAPKPSGVKKPKTVQPPAAKPTPALPQTNLFPD